MSDKTLREFLQEEMSQRKMTARKFAEFIDVAPSTITLHLKSRDSDPTLTFLHKLAKKTGVPLATIIAMAFPDVAADIADLPPDIVILATRFANLPEPIRDVIKRIVEGQ